MDFQRVDFRAIGTAARLLTHEVRDSRISQVARAALEVVLDPLKFCITCI